MIHKNILANISFLKIKVWIATQLQVNNWWSEYLTRAYSETNN